MLIFCFSSTNLVGFDLGILGICLVVLGVDLFVRRDRFSKSDE
ncbi:putative membrane protein [Pseudomonas paraeruginosa]|nr:putative membrane protein [Pseudomonas paraeruginosa]